MVLGRERHELAVAAEAGDPARTMLAEEQAAFAVNRETVRALVRGGFISAAGLEEDGGDRIAFDPLVGDVVGDVGEDDASLIPSGTFGPGVAAVRDGLDLGVARDQGVERRIELLDGLLGVGGDGGQDGEEEGGEELHAEGVGWGQSGGKCLLNRWKRLAVSG